MSDESKKIQLECPTQTLFPQMLQETRMLILDYDVTRYHSFDLFRHLLRNHDRFMECDPNIREMATFQEVPEQVQFFMKNNPNLNVYDNFASTKDTITVLEYEKIIGIIMPELMITPTDIGYRLGIIFDNVSVRGYILRYKNETFEPEYLDKLQVYTSENILDLRMASAIIQRNRINTIMLSSVDLAVLLSNKLHKLKIGWPITFMVCDYFYNHDPETGLLRRVPELHTYELAKKYEFGLTDPFTGLNTMRKEIFDE